jgi:hypothetical protein
MDQERPLGEGVLVHVLADGVEERLAAPARPIGEAHPLDEPDRRVGDVADRVGVVVSARGGGGADDVDSGSVGVQHVPAPGEQRLVGGGCRTRVVGVELRPPERADVGLVPNDDVIDRREADNGVLRIAAELGSRGIILRRATRAAVNG